MHAAAVWVTDAREPAETKAFCAGLAGQGSPHTPDVDAEPCRVCHEDYLGRLGKGALPSSWSRAPIT